MTRVVQASVPEGGLIGDFMGGSGTTAVAAFDLGRRFVTAERDHRAVSIMIERLEGRGLRVASLPPPPVVSN
jgi:adenine-specific DNA-methyltransferase